MNADPISMSIMGIIVIVIGILLYIMLPPTGYTHNPLTGLFRGIFICIIVFGIVLTFVGAIPYIESFVVGSGVTNMSGYDTAVENGGQAKMFIIGG